MSRILVTGGAGFIGSHLADALAEDGHDIVVFDNLMSGSRDNLLGLGNRVRFVEGDILDIAANDFGLGKFDAIYHLAALISGYDSLKDPDSYVDSNVKGFSRLIDFAVRNGKPRIIFASSSTVYGNQVGASLSEDTPPRPLTMYALSKLAGEHMLRLFAEMHGFSHCSLRLFNVYGPRQSINHPYANVTCKFSHAAATGAPVNLYGDGAQSRDFIFVADVVRAFVAILDRADHEIYNVGTGQTATINELLETVGDISGRTPDTTRHPSWPNDIRSIRADISRIREEFGYSAMTSLREGLERTVEFFSNCES